jgi:hypothetical protein
VTERVSGGHGHTLPVTEDDAAVTGSGAAQPASDGDVEMGAVGRSTSLSLTTTQPQPTVASGAAAATLTSPPGSTGGGSALGIVPAALSAPAAALLSAAALSGPESTSSRKSRSAMVGLVVHAAVDGVALGSAVANGDSTLGMIVFVAIMLHKAPSSFGLASYLLHNGMSRARVQRRLFIFSLAAPLGAVATYALLSLHLFVYTMVSRQGAGGGGGGGGCL